MDIPEKNLIFFQMKLFSCESVLNFANLEDGINSIKNYHSPHPVDSIDSDHRYIIRWSTPKLIKSDNESNSTPKFEFVFKYRAILPSILSKKEAKTTRETEISHLLSIANFKSS